MEGVFKVPIRNLFCMLSYMNEMPELAESLNELDEDIITYDFIALQFIKEAERILHRGMTRDYILQEKETNKLGGRLLLNQSLPRIMARKPVMVCEKDEYSANVRLNQIMKATFASITTSRFIKEETRRRSFIYLDTLHEVGSPALTKGLFSKVYFGRHNLYYRRMVHIAKLLHELTLLSHKQGNWSLFTAEIDEKALNQLFEKFLFHFYRIEQKEFYVSSEKMQWQLQGNPLYLPTMQTDISLAKKDRSEKIIIDAKFYKSIFQDNRGKSSFHSHNMYQLFAYLMHQPKNMSIRGILIYPFNGLDVNEAYTWSENVRMEVRTINLDADWKEIHRILMDILAGS